MKPFIISLIPLLLGLQSVFGQTVTDSICFDLETNRRIMREVTERDEYKAKNEVLKKEVANLEFSVSRCNEKLFKKDEVINQLRAIDQTSVEQVTEVQKENAKLKKKLKRRNWMLYGAGGVGIFGIIYGLLAGVTR